MKIFLCQYRSTSAVVAAHGIAEARKCFVDTVDGSSYLMGIDRKLVKTRELKNVTHPGAADDAQPFKLASIGG